jgi:predicted negative regulator of RcsB-dependent stress response
MLSSRSCRTSRPRTANLECGDSSPLYVVSGFECIATERKSRNKRTEVTSLDGPGSLIPDHSSRVFDPHPFRHVLVLQWIVNMNGKPDCSRTTRTRALICLALTMAILVVYLQTLHFGISDFDDTDYVWDNPFVRTGLSWDNVLRSITTSHAGNWHPVTWISHMIDVSLYGTNPGPHHFTSVLIHILNTCLLFLMLSSMTGSIWRSAFVAALFALHPINVESVAWISERKNVLSTTFWLLTIWAYFAYVQRAALRRYALVVVAFALGLAAKPMLVTLPLILLLIDFWPVRKPAFPNSPAPNTQNPTPVTLLLNKTPLLAMSLVSCWITITVQTQGGMTRTLEDFPVGQRLANAVVSYVSYVGKMFWPARLCVLYPHPEDTLPVWLTVLCCALVLGITIAAFAVRRKRSYVLVGWLWYLIALVPVIGIVQVGPQAMADRYAYVPFIGLFVVVAWLVPDLLGSVRSRWLAVPAVLVMIPLGVTSWVQAQYWKDSHTIFTHALSITGNNGAVIYCEAGALADSNKLGQSLQVLHNALKDSREPEVVHNFMGMLLIRAGRVDEGLAHYRKAIEIDPGYAVAHNNLGTALARLGEIGQAETHLRKAVQLKPDYAQPHHSLGVILWNKGRKREAMAEWRRALELRPSLTESRTRLEKAGHDSQ